MDTNEHRLSELGAICHRKEFGIRPHFDPVINGRVPVGAIASLGVLGSSHFFADKSYSYAGHVADPRDPNELRTVIVQEPNDLVVIAAYPQPTLHAVGFDDRQRRSLLIGYAGTTRPRS